jgi:hypothetical protein
MKNWLMTGKSKSDKETFAFIHHSTSSVIQVQMNNEFGSIADLWMDYSQFDELCDFINQLSENKQKQKV